MKQILLLIFFISSGAELYSQTIPSKLNGTYCESSEYVGFCITFEGDTFQSVVGSMMFDVHSKGIYRIKEKQLTLYHGPDTLNEGNIMRYELLKVTPDEIIWTKDGSKSVLKKSKQ